MKRQPNIELHIAELVLHGFASRDRAGIAAAVERELARLFSERELPTSWSKAVMIDRIAGASVRVPTGARPSAVGKQVAQAVHASVQSGGVKQ